MRFNRQCATLVLAAAISGGLACHGQDSPEAGGPDIVTRSPFIPPGFTPPSNSGPAAAKQTAGGYEFRGVYQIGDEYRFLVSPPRSRAGTWVQLGKSYEEYEVRRYDAATETLTLFYNNTETKLSLAELEANPTPTPVSGQIQTPAVQGAAPQAAPQPVRRTIRPATRSAEDGSASPPPPAWLEKLREEAAARRAQAAQSRFGAAGSPGAPTSAPNDMQIPEPPSSPPPTPPPNLTEVDIPPPPTTLPPPPPPEVLKQIQQSMNFSPVPPNG